MRIDKSHKPWLLGTLAALLLGAAAYIQFAVGSPSGPRGGSKTGLIFGYLGYGMMLSAAVLGLRKKRPTWRIGRAQAWMRWHLWVGTLSLFFILFHGGCHARGLLTMILTILLFIVIGSGWVGALIQHYIPKMMTARVPMETIYEEIPNVRKQLRKEANQLVTSICGPLDDEIAPSHAPAEQREPQAEGALVDIEQADRANFREVYMRKVRPFLEKPDDPGAELADPQRATEVFESLRRLVAAPLHGVLNDLENICEEANQLRRQRRIYHWLHGWLLVHVPLSIALLVLAAVHAVMASRY